MQPLRTFHHIEFFGKGIPGPAAPPAAIDLALCFRFLCFRFTTELCFRHYRKEKLFPTLTALREVAQCDGT